MKKVNIKAKKKIKSQKNKNVKSILMKGQNGITLIALIISIIVMLILAGVSLNATIGENGIISRAQESKLKQEEASVETEILSGVAALDTEYYEKVSSDSGITINSIYSISGLSKYVKGKINGFNYSKNGTSTVYYTNEMGSYTVVIDKKGQAKTYSGIYVEKNQVSSIQMDKNDKITLSTDIQDVVWAVVSGDATVNPTTGEVVKNSSGTVIIKGADTNGNEVTVIIKDNQKNNVAKDTDVTKAIEEIDVTSTAKAYIIPNKNADGNTLIIKGTGLITNEIVMENEQNVKNIIIEDGIEGIINGPLKNFGNTESLTIPSTLKYFWKIGIGLKKITTLNYNAVSATPVYSIYGQSSSGFDMSDNLKTINIGENVTNIPSDFFATISSLEYITIPNSVTKIEENAFYECSNLKYVVMGNNVEEIGDYAFCDATNLSNVVLSDNLKNIGKYSFFGSSIKEITIPENVTSIGTRAFCVCKKLETVYYNAIDCKYEGYSDNSIDPLFMIYKSGINNVLKTIKIGNSVKNIPDGIFPMCEALLNLEIGENVEKIGIASFFDIGIEELTLPSKITTIGTDAFARCLNLKKVYYNIINCEYNGANVKNSFVDPVFFLYNNGKNDKIESIKIGNEVKKIPNGFFWGCTAVTNLDLGNGVENIGDLAFGSLAIKELTLPESLRYIGAWAFSGCNDLETLYYNSIHCSTENIYADYDYYPFQSTDNEDVAKCYNIENIIIGDKVEYLDSNIFRKCNITTITIPSNVKYIAYEGGNNQSKVENGTFYNCTFLKEIIVKKPENSIVGAPWSNVSGITVKWEP